MRVCSQEAKGGYVVILMAIYWCTECIPLAVTALLPLILFPILGIMRADEVQGFFVFVFVFYFLFHYRPTCVLVYLQGNAAAYDNYFPVQFARKILFPLFISNGVLL